MIDVLIVTAVGGAIYRTRGMGMWHLPRPLWQLAFSSAYAAAALAVAPWWASLTVLLVTMGAASTGHASYMDLGSVPIGAPHAPKDGKPDEWYGTWIPGRGYWHEFAGLAVSGLLISAPVAIAFAAVGEVTVGIAALLSGALKAPAYGLAWWAYRRWDWEPISIAEAGTGALLWGSLALIVGGLS